VENLGGRMRRMKKRGPHVLCDLNDLLFSLQQQQLILLKWWWGCYQTFPLASFVYTSHYMLKRFFFLCPCPPLSIHFFGCLSPLTEQCNTFAGNHSLPSHPWIMPETSQTSLRYSVNQHQQSACIQCLVLSVHLLLFFAVFYHSFIA